MKHTASALHQLATFILLLLAAHHNMASAGSTPIGTAFNYQGLLRQNGQPVNASADFQFWLFAAEGGGSAIAGPLSILNANVVDGSFTVELDFGNGVFGTDARWLEIAVRSPGGSGEYQLLSPRQRILSVPLAQFALSVDSASLTNLNASNITSGTLPSAALSGNYSGALTLSNPSNTMAGSGAGLTSLNATNIANGTLADARLSGNVALLNNTQTFTGAKTFSNAASSFTGNGVGLTGLNASNVTAGVLNPARLPNGGSWALSSVLSIASGNLAIDPITDRVGIGTNLPSERLDIEFGNIAMNDAYSINWGNSTVRGYNGAVGYIDFTVNGSVAQTISASGNVGIGTSAPQAQLHLGGTTSTLQFGSGTSLQNFYFANESISGQGRQFNLYNNNLGRLLTVTTFGVKIGPGDNPNENPSAYLEVAGTAPGMDPLRVRNDAGDLLLRVNAANSRTVVKALEITGGADLSEHFDIATYESGFVQPGMVVCIDRDNPGKLVLATNAYDRTVAGVISGAGGVSTGMVLGQTGSIADGQHPVALSGRVYVWCDASGGMIEPGDLLTTSDLPGHAMKVLDDDRARGAVIGKAMSRLDTQRGLVLVLICLQ